MCYMNNSTHLRNSPQPSLDEASASIFRKSTRSDGLSSASATCDRRQVFMSRARQNAAQAVASFATENVGRTAS